MAKYVEVQELRDQLTACQDRMWAAMGAEFGNRLNNYPDKEREAILTAWKKENGASFCSPELAEMLMKIPERYGKRANFFGYTFNDDMIAQAQMDLIITVWWKYDTSLTTSPFGYLTQCVHNNFITYLNREKKGRDTMMELRRFEGLDDPFNEQAKRDMEKAMETTSIPISEKS